MTVNPLSIALTGLRVAQAQIGVASNNVANVSTDGYTRKILHQTSNVIGEEGAGATTGLIERRVNAILLKDYRTQISLTSGLTTRASYLSQVQEFHGPPDTQEAISFDIARLKDAFSQLANQPENTFMLTNVYNKATQVVEKLQNFSERLVEMRNNAQLEMSQSVGTINSLSAQIADLNTSIKVARTQERSTAELEDQRDLAIRELARELDLSYFENQDGVMVVMTRNGQLLADTLPVTVYFQPAAMGATTYYPASATGIMLGNPTTGTDLTTLETLGGRLGALVAMRDDLLPVYHAQADELAHKLALRFESQGLRLFTSPDGTIPANTPAAYVGFSSDIVVNPSITSDKTLIRKGTNPLSTVQAGSSEVLRKIIEFAFGDVQYQQGLGDVDISNLVPTLFTTLGITGEARVRGENNIVALGSLDSSPFIEPGAQDTFTIQIGAAPAQTITILPGMTAATLVTAINTAIPGLAELGTGGELILTATDDITIGGGTLLAAGVGELGLEIGLIEADPPYFEVAIGNNDLVRIEILETDTTTDLLDKLNTSVFGITASLTTPGGFLQIRPDEGGDITFIDGLGSPLDALGLVVSDIAHTAFNVTNLGPGSSLNARIQTASTIHDYATQAVGIQSQDGQNVDINLRTEENYRAVLEKQNLDSSGVNLDEEMALLISIQTAYNASARTISVVQQMLEELVNTMR